ncbi:GNAT family N-acetyltransferase [soil metagenome]
MGERDGVELRQVGYTDPAVTPLVARLQAEEYVVRYGGHDDTPIAAGEFSPPEGVLLVGCRDGDAVAMGGWRRHVEDRSGRVPWQRAVEIKRMYVVPEARGLGVARRLLADLERLARAGGAEAMVLETGAAQPEAIALYRSSGYRDIPAFGHYCASDQSVHLGKPLAGSSDVVAAG